MFNTSYFQHAKKYARGVVLVLGMLALNACLTLPSTADIPPEPLQKQHENALTNLVNWRTTGKIGYRLPDEAGSVFVTWEQAQDHYAIQLSGPLNIGAAQVTGNQAQAVLTLKNKRYTTERPEYLFYDALGWPLPIGKMMWWIKGLPAPSPYKADYDANGLLTTLEQDAWLLTYYDYRAYQQSEQTLYLPRKLTAERDDIKLTFILKNWRW